MSWILHSSTKKHALPWHRVINSKGEISMSHREDKEYQKILLEQEGIIFEKNYKLNLKKYIWDIKSIEEIEENRRGYINTKPK